MDGEQKKPRRFGTKSFLFCLYVAGYIALRHYGEVTHQRLGGSNNAPDQHIVGVRTDFPRWKRQAYRAAFSPLMVAEEELRLLADRGLSVVDAVERFGRGYLPGMSGLSGLP